MELKVFFRDIMGLDDERTIEKLAENAIVQQVPKRAILLRQGENSGQIFFLMSGGVKYYSVDKDKKVHIDFFALRAGYPAMIVILSMDDAPSPVTIETLVQSEIVSVPREVFMQLYDTDLQLCAMHGEWQLSYLAKQKALIRIYYQDATARYLRFLHLYPRINEIASQKDIACFLNMTPERLSNIKRELKEKNTE